MRGAITRSAAVMLGLGALICGFAAAPPAVADSELVFDSPSDAPARVDIDGVRVINEERAAVFVLGFRDLRPGQLGWVEVLMDTGRRNGTGWAVNVRRFRAGDTPRVRFARVLIATDAPPERVPCPGIEVGVPGDGARPDIVRISVPQACMHDDADRLRMSVVSTSRRKQDLVPGGDMSGPIDRG